MRTCFGLHVGSTVYQKSKFFPDEGAYRCLRERVSEAINFPSLSSDADDDRDDHNWTLADDDDKGAHHLDSC